MPVAVIEGELNGLLVERENDGTVGVPVAGHLKINSFPHEIILSIKVFAIQINTKDSDIYSIVYLINQKHLFLNGIKTTKNQKHLWIITIKYQTGNRQYSIW